MDEEQKVSNTDLKPTYQGQVKVINPPSEDSEVINELIELIKKK